MQAGLVKASGIIAGRKSDLKPEITLLEKSIEARAAKMKPPRKFVLPGANEREALAHIARAKARICEILAWELKAREPAVYLNRLSDALFRAALGAARM